MPTGHEESLRQAHRAAEIASFRIAAKGANGEYVGTAQAYQLRQFSAADCGGLHFVRSGLAAKTRCERAKEHTESEKQKPQSTLAESARLHTGRLVGCTGVDNPLIGGWAKIFPKMEDCPGARRLDRI